jgi:hypothetical protein
VREECTWGPALTATPFIWALHRNCYVWWLRRLDLMPRPRRAPRGLDDKIRSKKLFFLVSCWHPTAMHVFGVWFGCASGRQRCLVPRTPVTKTASPALLEPPAEFVTRPANDRPRTEYQTPLMVGDERQAKPQPRLFFAVPLMDVSPMTVHISNPSSIALLDRDRKFPH